MASIKVATVFGTRPEAIKLAPVIQQLRKDRRFESTVIVTAQHREMLDQVLAVFGITPDHDLDLMTENQELPALTASIFNGLDPILKALEPDWLLVQGDTTTVMAAALNAFYRRIKVGHVEAGLRTHDKWQPFPEEINRRIAGVVADLHFAPTDWARANLLREGIRDEIIKITGNTIIDSLNMISELPMPGEIKQMLDSKGILSGEKKLVVVTAHRRENFGEPIRDICSGLRTLAENFADEIEIVYPVHLNPNIQEPVHEMLADKQNITLTAPLEYLSLVHLLKHAYLVLTDSGGIQEESTGLGVPCLVLRERTERPEGVEAGVLKLVGTDRNKIISTASELISSSIVHDEMAKASNPYGDGRAAEKIVSLLV